MTPTFPGGARAHSGATPMLPALRAYWDSLRDGLAVPSRDKIDPRGLAGALEHVFLIERIAPGLARFRVSGMEVNALLGTELRGTPFALLFESTALDTLQTQLEAVFSGPAILDLQLTGPRGLGRMPMSGRMVLLPLKGRAGQCDLAIGAVQTDAVGPMRAQRFGIERALREPIATLRPVVDPSPAPKAPPNLRLLRFDA
ncbi:MAG: PAS domain-containing protein [Pseudomonadota bacterium]